MIPSKYRPPIKNLGTAAVLVLLIGLVIFPIIRDSLLPEDVRDGVLAQSIPFVAVFITIILMYALLMFMVAYRFNRQIPYRTYRPLELTAIAGIIAGVICLFQPWQIVSFQYGFLLLLGSTLFFILWSHVVSQSAAAGKHLPPFTQRDMVMAALAALVVVIGLSLFLAINGKPEAPYGYSDRQWERGLREEQRQEIIDDEESTYRNFSVPFFVVLSLFPASLVFFPTREIVASMNGAQQPEADSASQVMAASS